MGTGDTQAWCTLVAVAATPHDKVLATKALGDLEALLDLCRGHRYHRGIRVRRATIHVTTVREEVAPAQAHAAEAHNVSHGTSGGGDG